ncbi:PREDICTED: auxin-responsive protein SAUR64-like [Camelina sativa]|uniref:Auxin-responsive protein SAUR64-like n=1 Tax=Camelina sativa TaxID=90675 RepID=A0ABM1R9I1_CAMSA|nr:PREDICTED: auxin-responsive protein SAUR64-like [Camelina sativa]
MMNTKKLIKMAKKWQQRAALHRKRISFQRSSTATSSTAAEKGCFVVYTTDRTRFAFPISYLSNSVFQELLKISEEEFGLSTDGPNDEHKEAYQDGQEMATESSPTQEKDLIPKIKYCY